MRSQRIQEGGPGPSFLNEDRSEMQADQTAQAAQIDLKKKDTQLQAQIETSKALYESLCLERRKVSRSKTAKMLAEANAAEAQSSLEDLGHKFEQLTFKHEQLEMTMSQLLEQWA